MTLSFWVESTLSSHPTTTEAPRSIRDWERRSVLAFLEKMLVNGEVVPEAVSSVTNEFRLDQEPVQLRYYNKVLEIESDDLLDELEIESDDLLDELEIESDELLDESEITNQPRMIIGP